jgi:hypothetical protein
MTSVLLSPSPLALLPEFAQAATVSVKTADKALVNKKLRRFIAVSITQKLTNFNNCSVQNVT